jgi:hypothetical protein
MLIWKYLHILSMFLAVALVVGPDLLLYRTARSGEVRAIRTVFGLARPLSLAVPVAFALGLLFGFLAVFAGGFDLFAPWLVIAYVVFAIGALAGAAVVAPWQRKVAAAAATSPEGAPSPALAALLRDRKPTYAMLIDFVTVVGTLFAMVMKPFS